MILHIWYLISTTQYLILDSETLILASFYLLPVTFFLLLILIWYLLVHVFWFFLCDTCYYLSLLLLAKRLFPFAPCSATCSCFFRPQDNGYSGIYSLVWGQSDIWFQSYNFLLFSNTICNFRLLFEEGPAAIKIFSISN